MNFGSDNVYGVHPVVMDAVVAANSGTQSSYGTDDYTRKAQEQLSAVFECDLDAFLVLNGTAANSLCLSAMTPPYGAVICHGDAHILVDECGAPELFTGGAKLIGVNDPMGKLTSDGVEKVLNGFTRGEHDPKPAAVSITQASELGTVYSVDEIAAIGGLAHSRGMKLHMDGARFANALVSLGCTPAEMTWKAGVDALSFGCTKNGTMMLEAVVFFDRALAADFSHRRMRAAQLLSKGRFLGAQMNAYLENDLWLDNARHANDMATYLGEILQATGKMRMPLPVQANEVFPIMPRPLFDMLLSKGVVTYQWPGEGPGNDVAAEDEILARFVCSFLTSKADCDALVKEVETWNGAT
ncbi:beta-eliminating lyase-related protein [Anderseniella sp. Alg231-50]|uniref:beta-eliminating lyase-related protein n=1 Tax=Anderseniella sp. Alg231-50 TaxID=1922226 RepID=UPI000D5519BB